MLMPEEKEHLEEIYKRYHTDDVVLRMSSAQVAFDIGWLMGLVFKLDNELGK